MVNLVQMVIVIVNYFSLLNGMSFWLGAGGLGGEDIAEQVWE